MDAAMQMRPELLLPEVILFTGGLLVLLGGSYLPRTRQWLARLVAAVVLVAAATAAAIAMTGPAQTAFDGTFAVDVATGATRIIAALATLLILGIAGGELANSPRESDTYALLLFTTTGVMVLAGATDLLVLIVGFLLTSIPLYAIIGLTGGKTGAEAAMKTYLLGALSGILLMLGTTVLYGMAGGTDYAMVRDALSEAPAAALGAGALAVIAGLLFKAGGPPMHFWVPDAAQGSGVTAATYLTTVPKIGALVAIYRLVDTVLDGQDEWLFIVALLATVSMLLGNLAAFWQHDPRRLLGWSTVSQVGFLLVPIAAAGHSHLALPSLLLYLAAYTVTNIAAFAVTGALPSHRTLANYRGLAWSRPGLAFALLVALLGLVGTPPLAVFVGKLTTASAAWDAGYGWLTAMVVLNTVLSLFYYLRWFGPVFARPGGHTSDAPRPSTATAWPAATAMLTAAVSAVLGIFSGPLWQLFTGPLVP